MTKKPPRKPMKPKPYLLGVGFLALLGVGSPAVGGELDAYQSAVVNEAEARWNQIVAPALAASPTKGHVYCGAVANPLTFASPNTFEGAVNWVNGQYDLNPNVILGSGQVFPFANTDWHLPQTYGYIGCVTEAVLR